MTLHVSEYFCSFPGFCNIFILFYCNIYFIFYAVNGFSAVHSLIAEKNSVIRRLGYIYM